MSPVFLDTVGLLAVWNEDDQWHLRDRRQSSLASSRRDPYFPAMVVDELRSLMRARPFKPFSVITADGSEVAVHHHDYAWVLQSGAEIHVEQRDRRVDLVSVAQITELRYQPQPESPEPTGTAPRG